MGVMPEPKSAPSDLFDDEQVRGALAQMGFDVAAMEAAARRPMFDPNQTYIGAAPVRTMEEEQEIQRRILANKIAQQNMQATLDFTDPTTRRASAGLLTAATIGPPGVGTARTATSAISGGSKVVAGAAKVYGGVMKGIGQGGKFVARKADDAIEATTKMGRPLARAEAFGKRAIDPKIGGRALSERLPYYELPHESGAALLSEIALGTRRPYLGVIAQGLGAAGLTVAVDALGNLSIVSDTLKNIGGVSSRARGAIRKGVAGAIESVAEGAADFIGPKSEDFYNGK